MILSSRELMDHTHSTVLLFRVRDYLCNVVFLSLSLVFRQGPHLRMMSFSLRFSPLLLVVDLDENGPRCIEPSTRWKYQIRPSGDRTPRKRRSPPDTGPDPPLQPRLSGRDSELDSRPLSASGMSETRIELGTFDPRAL